MYASLFYHVYKYLMLKYYEIIKILICMIFYGNNKGMRVLLFLKLGYIFFFTGKGKMGSYQKTIANILFV